MRVITLLCIDFCQYSRALFRCISVNTVFFDQVVTGNITIRQFHVMPTSAWLGALLPTDQLT